MRLCRIIPQKEPPLCSIAEFYCILGVLDFVTSTRSNTSLFMNEQELYNLLRKAQNGDRDAFGVIYDLFKEKIYKFIFFRVSHKELAEDIMSDTFVKAWLKITDINTPKALSSWLFQVAKNNIIDYYRLKKAPIIPIEDVADMLPDSDSPVDTVNLTMEHKKLLELMEYLSQDQQTLLQYRFFEDLTNEEIASIMNKTEVWVRVSQHRAIAKLQQLLHKRYLKS